MRWRVVIGLTAVLTAFAPSALARVFVCIENGQKVFRSTECPDEKSTVSSYTAPHIRVLRPRELYSGAARTASPSPQTPTPLEVAQDYPRCKFSYFVLSERGNALAQDAKRECLQNLALENADRSGERSLSAYTMWRDYWDSARANAPRTMTCNYVGYGITTCR